MASHLGWVSTFQNLLIDSLTSWIFMTLWTEDNMGCVGCDTLQVIG